MKKIWITVIVFFSYISLHGIVIGSYDIVSRQGQVVFPSIDTDNQIIGFTFMEEGFILEDGKTTCSISNQFPFSGDMFFNSGTIYLLNDFLINQGARAFSPPTIYGSGRKIIFPFVQNTAILPASFYPNFITRASFDNTVSSVDWNFDNNWLAVALSVDSSDQIHIISFDGTESVDKFTLSIKQDINPLQVAILADTTINSIKWHPNLNILAIGGSSSTNDELLIYEFNNTVTTLTETDTASIGDAVTSLVWHPTGNWLAVGTQNTTDEVRIFSFTQTTSTVAVLAIDDLSPHRSIQKNAMSWNSAGEYLAVGVNSDAGGEELLVYYFDESTITVTASVDIGATVSSLEWHPTLPLLAVGLSEGLQKTRIYSFSSATATLTELTTARTNELFAVNSVRWHKDGVLLLVHKAVNPGFEIQIYLYNPIAKTLTLYNQAKQIDTINDVNWSPNGLFFAMGGASNSMYFHSADIAAAKIIDTALIVRSKLTFLGAVLFKGVSSIDATGSEVDIANVQKFLIGSGTTILFKNVILKGVSDDTLNLEDDTVKIIFDNSTLVLDGIWTVSMGSMEFKNKVIIGGEGTLVYQTAHTSTINSNSELILDEGATFSYDPILVASKNLIEYADNSSTLILNGGTLHATTTGLSLKKGKFKIARNSELRSEKSDTLDEGVTFGDSTSANDIKVEISGSVLLDVMQGSLNYKNVLSSSLIMARRSELKINSDVTLRLFENMNVDKGTLSFEENATWERASGKTVTGDIEILGEITLTAM